MRTSVLTYNEAVEEVKNYFNGLGLNWDGKSKYVGDYVVEDNSADCCSFPCPRELDNWSGETNALYVYEDGVKEVFAVAYWE